AFRDEDELDARRGGGTVFDVLAFGLHCRPATACAGAHCGAGPAATVCHAARAFLLLGGEHDSDVGHLPLLQADGRSLLECLLELLGRELVLAALLLLLLLLLLALLLLLLLAALLLPGLAGAALIVLGHGHW